MGMNVGSSSGGEAEPMMDINTTPLIDVMLVLIIMLIITIPPQMHSVNIDMPVSVPPTEVKKIEMRLDITAESEIRIDGQPPITREQLDVLMTAEGAKPTDQQPALLIRPDKAAKYDTVAYVMANAQRRNMRKLAIIGGEQFMKP
jgi:biopolymer transport protein ExbD